MADETNRVEAVERALRILDAFREGEATLSLAEIAARTGLYKSTILRSCGSLQRYGYLRRTADRRFQLGPSLWRLGTLYRQSFDLGEFIRPELAVLVDKTQETASFYVREGDQRVCLYRCNSPRPVRHHLDEGVAIPLDRGAAGRVLLACDGAPGEPYDTIRTQGWYGSHGERDPDVAAVAVPVVDRQDCLRGVLAVSALITRFGEQAAADALGHLRASAARLRMLLPV